jgi:hypothetical protein
MISSETLRTTILAIGLSFLLMMVYVALKFNAYNVPAHEYSLENEKTLFNENKNIVFNNDSENKY